MVLVVMVALKEPFRCGDLSSLNERGWPVGRIAIEQSSDVSLPPLPLKGRTSFDDGEIG